MGNGPKSCIHTGEWVVIALMIDTRPIESASFASVRNPSPKLALHMTWKAFRTVWITYKVVARVNPWVNLHIG